MLNTSAIHTIHDIATLVSLSPRHTKESITLTFEANAEYPDVEAELFEDQQVENLLSVETFSFKNVGVIAYFYNDRVEMSIYCSHHQHRPYFQGRGEYYFTNLITSSKEGYLELVGKVLTDDREPLWYFRFGSGLRQKYGVILNAMLNNSEGDVFTGRLKNKTLELRNKFVHISNEAGDVIFMSRVSRLQKTLLKD